MSVGLGSSRINTIDIWYDSDEEKQLDLCKLMIDDEDFPSSQEIHVNHDTLYPKELASVTRSGRVYDSSGRVRENGQENPREKSQESLREKTQEDESENKIVKQLKRTQATLTIWDAIIASRACREAVMEALSKMTVSAIATPGEVIASLYCPPAISSN